MHKSRTSLPHFDVNPHTPISPDPPISAPEKWFDQQRPSPPAHFHEWLDENDPPPLNPPLLIATPTPVKNGADRPTRRVRGSSRIPRCSSGSGSRRSTTDNASQCRTPTLRSSPSRFGSASASLAHACRSGPTVKGSALRGSACAALKALVLPRDAWHLDLNHTSRFFPTHAATILHEYLAKGGIDFSVEDLSKAGISVDGFNRIKNHFLVRCGYTIAELPSRSTAAMFCDMAKIITNVKVAASHFHAPTPKPTWNQHLQTFSRLAALFLLYDSVEFPVPRIDYSVGEAEELFKTSSPEGTLANLVRSAYLKRTEHQEYKMEIISAEDSAKLIEAAEDERRKALEAKAKAQKEVDRVKAEGDAFTSMERAIPNLQKEYKNFSEENTRLEKERQTLSQQHESEIIRLARIKESLEIYQKEKNEIEEKIKLQGINKADLELWDKTTQDAENRKAALIAQISKQRKAQEETQQSANEARKGTEEAIKSALISSPSLEWLSGLAQLKVESLTAVPETNDLTNIVLTVARNAAQQQELKFEPAIDAANQEIQKLEKSLDIIAEQNKKSRQDADKLYLEEFEMSKTTKRLESEIGKLLKEKSTKTQKIYNELHARMENKKCQVENLKQQIITFEREREDLKKQLHQAEQVRRRWDERLRIVQQKCDEHIILVEKVCERGLHELWEKICVNYELLKNNVQEFEELKKR